MPPRPMNFYDLNQRQLNVPRELVDWASIDKRYQRVCCGGSFAVAAVGAALLGSALFGLNASALNTSVDHIASEYHWCGENEAAVDCTKAKWLKTLVSCALFMGAVFGASIAGTMSNKYGIRRTMLATLSIFTIGLVSSAAANSFSSQFFARFVVGLAVGSVSGLSPNYIAEMVPAQRRGFYGTLHQIAIVGSQLLAMVLGLVFTPLPDSTSPWKMPIKNK